MNETTWPLNHDPRHLIQRLNCISLTPSRRRLITVHSPRPKKHLAAAASSPDQPKAVRSYVVSKQRTAAASTLMHGATSPSPLPAEVGQK